MGDPVRRPKVISDVSVPPVGKQPAFEVTARVILNLDVNLALTLGDFIVDHKPTNGALWALGCKLRDLIPPEKDEDYDRVDRG